MVRLPEAITAANCQGCGACCVSEQCAATDGFYACVTPEDFRSMSHPRRNLLVGKDVWGNRFMRVGEDGRCLALTGVVGESVACSFYKDRPAKCSEFEPGSHGCLKARKEAGIA